jgi:2'-deoxynucleoside 5'-phosphate N-hydrolase
MKKVYFACSISGGRDHAHVYSDVVAYIKAAGAEVLSELFADPTLTSETGSNPEAGPDYIWKRDYDWVKEADAIIADVTLPSLGVGYEIGTAQQWDTPVLALFFSGSARRLSPMLSGNPHVQIVTYDDISETKDAIRAFLEKLPD